MAMIACPGCGLPREEEQVGAVPCPVCDAGPAAVETPARPATAKAAAPDPTANLPADVSQLHAAPAVAAGSGNFFGWAVVFLLGAGAGAGGILGWQAAFPPGEPKRDPDPDTAQAVPPDPKRPAGVAVAPMPHEPAPRKAETIPETKPEPKPEPPPPPKVSPPPERAVIVELDQPDAVYTVPFGMKKGERVVLRGRVKTLRVKGLDGGAILDASALQTRDVSVSGKIDGRSTLRVNAPDGVVMFNAPVAGKSSVEVNAPGGQVRFDSAIEGGSGVLVTARRVDIRGEVNGIETKVAVAIPGDGALKVAAVRGIASVEYRVAGRGTPEVGVGTVSPTANFRKIE